MGLTTQTFDVLSRIAIGNGALVYRAVEKTSLRQVALKLLTQDGEVDHRLDIDALFADAARLKSIYGAHVCQLLDAYADEDGPVLVYEFASGLNGAELPQQKKLDATQALDVAAQLISALRSGERQRMPHGDLKPSNVIFNDLPEGRPFTFVLDWGLAAYRHTLSDDSLFYLAPERLLGSPPSHAADLFAAGAVLFYLYTGKVLVAGGSYDKVHAAWQKVRPEVLADLRPDLSSKLVQWVCQLLELDPAQRPASAVEASAVLAAMNPPPPVAPPESIRPRPVSAPTRFPVPAAAPSSVIAPAPRRSGIRPAPAGVSPTPRPRPKPSRPRKKSQLPAVLLGAFTAIALGGGAWFFLHHRPKEGPREPAQMAGATPSRAASPSVTAPVSTPPPRPLPGKESKKEPAPKASSAKPKMVPASMTAAAAPKDASPVIAIDSFDYPAGSELAAQGGGTGWADAWTIAMGRGGKIDEKSLSLPNIPGLGGSADLGETNDEIRWVRHVGPASRFMADPKKGGHWYFGAMVQHHGGPPGGGGEFQINPFSTDEPHQLIHIVLEDTGTSTRVTLNREKSIDVPDQGAPIALIVALEARNPKFDNYDFTAKLWVNPDFSAPRAPQTSDVTCTVLGQPLPRNLGVMLRKKRGQADTKIDEVRYARHWRAITGQKSDQGDE